MTAEELARALGGAIRAGREWKCLCPSHPDHDPSLSIRDNGSGKLLFQCPAGCDQNAVLESLRKLGLWPDDANSRTRKGEPIAVCDYRDEDGKLLFQVCRFANKQFLQRRPDGVGGWTWKLGDTRRVPYRLPELVAATSKRNGTALRVFVCEGEKDVDRLRSDWGVIASCNPGGSGKWRQEFARYFAGCDVVILGDNDDQGRSHVGTVAVSLAPVAASVRIPQLEGLPEKGDISDWIDRGGTQADLETLVELTNHFKLPDGVIDASVPPQLSDDALALEFSKAYASELRYVALWGAWLIWIGSRWRREETLKAFDLARALCRNISASLTNPKAARLATAIASAKTVAAVERLAKTDRRHAMTADQWDANP